MKCGCQPHSGNEKHKEAFGYLEIVGLREVAEEASALSGATARAIRQFEKAERAEQLGLGDEVAALYREDAERDRAQAVRQFRGVMARLDSRLGQDDWRELADRSTREFEERDGAALFEDARGRLRLEVLEMDGVPGPDAAVMMQVFSESLDRARAEGLDGAARLLRERLEAGMQALQSPGMGREQASPLTQNQTICLGIVSAMATAMMIACAFAPYCWCCGWWVIILWLAAAQILCIAG